MKNAQHGSTNLYIGPAGWSYKDWVGPVYPAGTKVDQLATIARYFDCVELNSSFYRIPGERLVESWTRRIAFNPRFRFTVKVWQRYTHEMKAESGAISEFIHRFDPLIERGALGAFLLQFPWSFKNEPANRRYIEQLGRWFSGHPATIELRHNSWNSREIIELLSDSGIAFCNIDQPVIGKSVPPTEYVTDERLGYIRLHGRNRKNWFGKEAGRDERYDYLYNENELEEWRDRAQRILERVQNLFVITNNHFRGQALVNAFQLKSMFEKRKLDMPPTLTSAYPELGRIAADVPRQGDLLDDG